MTVYLVGAGPGDPGLLTVRAAEVLRTADVVVHDRLAEASLLDLAPPNAVRIDVGKSPGNPVAQEEINRLLVERGRAGDEVVRLKGGDPFVFGRGGEEALALLAADVAFEVVPGVTSAVAVPAYAGIPVTHRGLATCFTVVTGHSRFAMDEDTDWEALARIGGTIVVLMGVTHRGELAARLMAGGLRPATPVAAVGWGTRPQQRTVRTTLAELHDTPLEPPVTLVIGAVAALNLGWYETRPLFGRRVVVTRAREQASELSWRLRSLGAVPLELPTIRIAPPADGEAGLRTAAASLSRGRYQWVVFSSVNAVQRMMDHVPDARVLAPVKIAAIGPGTAAALRGYRLVPDLVPKQSTGEGLLAEMPPPPAPRAALLLPRAAVGRSVLPEGLTAAGWTVDLVEAYRTERRQPTVEELGDAAGADAICFTSASTVTNYLEVAAGVPPVVVCIGPVTAAAAREAGLSVTATAESPSLEGLVEALVRSLSRRA